MPIEADAPAPRLDPLLQVQAKGTGRAAQRAATMPGLNFDGQGFSSVNPPDTVGDAGPSYFIQAINHSSDGSVCTVYSKTNGAVVAGPFTMKSIHADNVTGGGDPIVLYDEAAGRWLLSEFAPSPINELHVYISQTGDPIAGGWYHYTFTTPSFPDYPKYGVWPDAYYVTSNESAPAYYALDRASMLAGSAATMQRFAASSLAGFGFQCLTPADIDGAGPPPGSVHVAMRHRDDEAHNPGSNDPNEDYLELFEFSVDWATPANSGISGPTSIAITDFDSHLNGYTAFYAIAQPGTSTELDPLREPIMWRLQYRNFTTHETLCGSFVTDVDGTDHAGVRWFVLRRSGGSTWSLFDEGTYAPDANSRWMSSAALDASGNLAIGYNISSSTVYPGIRYTGRLASDPPGTLTLPETTIIAGSAANGSNRYGDYSSMSVDPSDGCTFWFTGQYNGASTWSTRVASFNFDNCGCAPPPIPASITATAAGDNRIEVHWPPSAGADSYNIYRSIGACQEPVFQRLATHVSGPTYVDTTCSGGSVYSYWVTAYKASTECESYFSSCDDAVTTGVCYESPGFGGVDSVSSADVSPCAIDVAWSAATPQCGGPVLYNVYRSTTTPVPVDGDHIVGTCIDGTNFTDGSVAPSIEYHYLVRAEDIGGVGSGACSSGPTDSNTKTLSASASGSGSTLFIDDIESGSGAWTTSAGPTDSGTTAWAQSTGASASPTNAWYCPGEGAIKDQMVQITAAQALPAGCASELTFQNYYDLESGWDGGVLEYSVNGGTSWFDILAGNGGAVPANANRFTSGGYNGTTGTGYSNPIEGRQAWTGDSGGFITSTVDLGDMAGMSTLLRWRLGCDSFDGGGPDWYIDDVAVNGCSPCSQGGYPVYESAVGWSGSGDPDADDNSDGVFNLAAYFHGVNPTGALSGAEQDRMPGVASDGTTVTYSFTVDTNPGMVANFVIRTNEDLLDGRWLPVLPTPTPAPDGTVELQIPASNITDQLFYQLKITE